MLRRALLVLIGLTLKLWGDVPIYITFLWHLHQPIYIPYDEPYITINCNGVCGGPTFGFSLFDMWASKGEPYKTWPVDALEIGLSLPHLGAQLNISGSLIESLNNLDSHYWNDGFYRGWKNRFVYGRSLLTAYGKRRLDIVAFPYHHPILGLIWNEDIELQIACHKRIYLDTFGSPYSRGLFPPETGFTLRAIPALVNQGIEWVIVDNIHLFRTLSDYPWTGASGVFEPNKSDQQNGALASHPHSSWVQLSGLWAPEKVASGWGYRPHYASYTDPSTGTTYRIIIIPASCYEGNEDARGGYGALNYGGVLSQLLPQNTDPAHPMLVLLHHDGENYGAGVSSYYHENFANFVAWAQANSSQFVPTTIEDYLNDFPPDTSDIVWVENGGWIGAGCLSPEFSTWLGGTPGNYSPDYNSWSVITAGHNWVWTANSIQPYSSIADIVYNSGNATARAFHYYLVAQTSCYEYWEGSASETIWNANPTRAVNQAIDQIRSLVLGGSDTRGPSIFIPQREPYNPGETENRMTQPTDCQIWTFIYDVHGVRQAELRYRVDDDTTIDYENKIYSGGSWASIPMIKEEWVARTNPVPYYTAARYHATISGVSSKLLDYYVYAEDSLGFSSRSPIQWVWIGAGGTGGGSRVSWSPTNPTVNDTITISVSSSRGGYIHWGTNGWHLPDSVYRPPRSYIWHDSMAIETPLQGSAPNFYLKLGPFNNPAYPVSVVDFVVHFNDNSWDNNSGRDYHIVISGSNVYVMDGNLDGIAEEVAYYGNYHLWVHFNGRELYVATNSQGNGGTRADDHFIFIANPPGALVNHPWVKAGMVASWSCYLGGENDNGWCGWFGLASPGIARAFASPSESGVLEGTLDIRAQFGYIPEFIYISAAGYQTQDNGILTWQLPPSSGALPQDIEACEYYQYFLGTPAYIPTNTFASDNLKALAYPNPFNPSITIKLNRGIRGEIEIYDICGRLVLKEKVQDSDFTWTPGKTNSGVYFYRVIAGGKIIETGKIVHIK